IVYSSTQYGKGSAPWASAFYNPPAYDHVYPDDPAPSILTGFPIDPKTGLVWGPPNLLNYNAALGEGDAPGLSSALGANNTPSYGAPAAAYGNYQPVWSCYLWTRKVAQPS